MTGTTPHTLHRFDEELARLRGLIARMGELADRQIRDVTRALATRDASRAAEVAARDEQLDALQREVETQVIRMLALRHPVALDLRQVVAALKVASDIERIGDYAANAAKRTMTICALPPVGSLNGFERMAALVQENLAAAIAAFAEGDAEAADRVWASDSPVDAIHTGIFRELLTHVIEDPRSVSAVAHLLFIAKNLERIGDHATNIAEAVHFAARGDQLAGERPKADATSETMLTGPNG